MIHPGARRSGKQGVPERAQRRGRSARPSWKRQVLMGMVKDKDLADGDYVVKWQTSGDDGHIQKGEYKFTLKSSH